MKITSFKLKNIFLLITLISIIFVSSSITTFKIKSINKLENSSNVDIDINLFDNKITDEELDFLSKGLNKQIEYYQALLGNADNIAEYNQILSLINTTQDLLLEAQSSSLSEIKDLKIVYSISVGLVISYFNSNGWVFASELLTHMRDNTDFNSIYKPINGSRVLSSGVMMSIIDGAMLSGSDTFTKNENEDLYYAINKFGYTKSANDKVVVITDRYDYDKGSYSWDSLAGIAVEVMYNAQQDGYLTPYYTVIETNIILSNQNPIPSETIDILSSDTSRNRYVERVATLGKGDSKDYWITYSTGGNKVWNTFGYKDTYLELYNEAGTLLTSNDDSGYKLNAFILYNFDSNVRYKLRVRFYSSTESGEIKIVGTPSYEPNYDGIYDLGSSSGTFGYTGVNRLDSYTYTSKSRTTKKFSLTGTFNDNLTGMYLYLIDPRSTVKIDIFEAPIMYSPNVYSPSVPAVIEKEIGKDIPYMLLMSSSNMSNSVYYSFIIS